MKIKLREKLITELGLEKIDKVEGHRIVDELVQLAVQKTMDDLLDELDVEEINDLQKYINKDPKDLPEMCQKHKKNLENFFIILNKNINEIIREFHRNTK